MAKEQASTTPQYQTSWLPGNQTDINAGSKRDTSSSGIFLIGNENARLHTSDCVAPTSINLIDLEPRWAPPELLPPCCWTEVDQSCAGGHNSITTQCSDYCLQPEMNTEVLLCIFSTHLLSNNVDDKSFAWVKSMSISRKSEKQTTVYFSKFSFANINLKSVALIREAGNRLMITLEELQRPIAQVAESSKWTLIIQGLLNSGPYEPVVKRKLKKVPFKFTSFTQDHSWKKTLCAKASNSSLQGKAFSNFSNANSDWGCSKLTKIDFRI